MRRRLLKFASAVSLMLFLAGLVLWVRSYFVSDYLLYDYAGRPQVEDGVSIAWCGITVDRLVIHAANQGDDVTGLSYNRVPAAKPGAFTYHWFAFHSTDNGEVRVSRLEVPWWACCISLLAVAVACAWGLRRRGALLTSCGHCAYDLTGNTSGICPECGTSVLRMLETAAEGADTGIAVARDETRTAR